MKLKFLSRILMVFAVAACTAKDSKVTAADTVAGDSGVTLSMSSTPAAIAPSAGSPAARTIRSNTRKASDSSLGRDEVLDLGDPKDPAGQLQPVPPLRDSATKPKYTVDEKGNIHPIKRDSLR